MTAIEKLVQTLIGFHDDFELAFSKEINKAKEMEKQQIIDAYEDGTYHNTFGNENYESSEEYYNKIFKK